MGSRCELQVYAPSASGPPTVLQDVVREVRRLEAKYTRYESSSVTSRINAGAGEDGFVDIDDETEQLLDYADALYVQSEGKFDLTSGILRRAWDFRAGRVPSHAQLSSLLPLIGWTRVERRQRAVRLPQAGMEIDFGGFVKEYAADAAAGVCLDRGFAHGLINLGGDVRVLGPHPDGAAWTIGIQHPRETGETIAQINVRQGGLATSGDYERFMMVGDQRYCHLLDPATGMSLQPSLASVSVLAESCLIAGSFSTISMLNSETSAAWLLDTGLPHLCVDLDMRVTGTLGTQ